MEEVCCPVSCVSVDVCVWMGEGVCVCVRERK